MIRILEDLFLFIKGDVQKIESMRKTSHGKKLIRIAVFLLFLLPFFVHITTYALPEAPLIFDKDHQEMIDKVNERDKEKMDEAKSPQLVLIESWLDTIFAKGDDTGFMAPATLLKNSYGYLSYAMTGEGDDSTSLEGAADFQGFTNLTLYKYIQGIALIMMFVLFFYEVEEENIAALGEMSLERAIKPYLKLIVSVFFIFNVQKFLSGFLFLSQYLCDSISSSLSTGNISIVDQLKEEITKDLGFTTGGSMVSIVKNILPFLSGALMLFCPFIVAQIANVGMFFVAFRRLLELACLTVFAPLAFIDIYKGANSHAMRFIRGYLAVCFQAAAIMIVLCISSIVCGIVFKQYFGSVDTGGGTAGVAKVAWTMVAIKLAQLTTLGSTAQITKKIFGGE